MGLWAWSGRLVKRFSLQCCKFLMLLGLAGLWMLGRLLCLLTFCWGIGGWYFDALFRSFVGGLRATMCFTIFWKGLLAISWAAWHLILLGLLVCTIMFFTIFGKGLLAISWAVWYLILLGLLLLSYGLDCLLWWSGWGRRLVFLWLRVVSNSLLRWTLLVPGPASRKVLWARAANDMQYRDRAIFHCSRIHPIRLLRVVLVWWCMGLLLWESSLVGGAAGVTGVFGEMLSWDSWVRSSTSARCCLGRPAANWPAAVGSWNRPAWQKFLLANDYIETSLILLCFCLTKCRESHQIHPQVQLAALQFAH